MKNLFKLFSIIFLTITSNSHSLAAEKVEYLKTDWSFKCLFGKFDRASLQRGYQVYTEVCASCHSMKYLSYRNLAEPGGPEFSEAQAKAIAASFEVIIKIIIENNLNKFFTLFYFTFFISGGS